MQAAQRLGCTFDLRLVVEGNVAACVGEGGCQSPCGRSLAGRRDADMVMPMATEAGRTQALNAA